MARQEVYRVLAELHKKSFVEKIIALPTEFKPVPLKDCLRDLFEHRKREISEHEKKATELLQKFKEKSAKNTLQEDSRFILVPEKEAYLRRFTNAIEGTQTSCDMILQWECFRYGMIEDTKTWEKTIEKGVKVRFIVYKPEKPEDEKDLTRIVQILKKKGSFKVRYIFTPPPATIAIFDKKETIITTLPTPHPRETPNLWSDNLSLIGVFQDYFELLWRALEDANTQNQDRRNNSQVAVQ